MESDGGERGYRVEGKMEAAVVIIPLNSRKAFSVLSEEQKKSHNGLRGGCRHPIMSAAAAAAAESDCDLFIFNIKAPRCSKPRGNINYHHGGRKGWKCCQANMEMLSDVAVVFILPFIDHFSDGNKVQLFKMSTFSLYTIIIFIIKTLR